MTAFKMKMPDLGEGVVEAELVTWLVKVGDVVTTQSQIAEVLTDKASVEVGAPVAGVVTALLVGEGTLVAVGSEIMVIEGEPLASDSDSSAEIPAQTDISVSRDEPHWAKPASTPSVPETPPTSEELSDDAVRNGSTVTSSGGGGSDLAPPLATPFVIQQDALDLPSHLRPLAAPTVRRRAKELEVDLAAVRGTGPHGRVLIEDVEAYLQGTAHSERSRRADQTEQLKGLRRAISQQLTNAWKAPHITYVDDVDVNELESLRAAVNRDFATEGRRVTMLPFIARAVVLACIDYPRMNATFDAEEGLVQIRGAIHLGIATQTDRGLVVAVVRDADQRSLSALTDEIQTVVQKARDGTAKREHLMGSTITISSLGALGGIMNTPILNTPEVAIVGVNKMQTKPVWNGSAFVPRPVMNLSASFDHRVIDGWDAAVFVQRIKQLLEAPALLTLGWAR